MPEVSTKSKAVNESKQLVEQMNYSEAYDLLLPFAKAADVRAHCALAECCLHLSEQATDPKVQKDRALESFEHAQAAITLDEKDAQAHIWMGQAMSIKAKALDGAMGQARVSGDMIRCWEKALEIAPSDPLANHLIGSFGYHVNALPWAAGVTLRKMSSGLKKYDTKDVLGYLMTSEENQPTPPVPYSVCNKTMIGKTKLHQGYKAEAKDWLEAAVALDDGSIPLDPAAKEMIADARKALSKMK